MTIFIFSGLKPNKSNWKIVGIRALEVIHVALYGMRGIDLETDAVKNFGIQFSCDKNLRTTRITENII